MVGMSNRAIARPVSAPVLRRRRLVVVAPLAIIAALIIGLLAFQQAPASFGGEPTEADGVIPVDQDLSVFDDAPAVAKLDSDLLDALRRAAEDAAGEGITLRVNSGWRSPAYQEKLLQQAMIEYGSREEAARWVATPEASAHVTGEAVDVSPYAASDWVVRHGQDYGLCQTYSNEPWHFELRGSAGGRCPEPYADPTEDPRLQR